MPCLYDGGIVSHNDDVVSHNDGAMSRNDGIVPHNDGVMSRDVGMIQSRPYGSIDNDYSVYMVRHYDKRIQ
ncbi:MAG TPA: hypothetical protein PKM65_17365 [Spirochaetota bacterium]|nr:hypothetical protein [Spirochaetota bacterium]HNT12239.1 hypothetical protein [Spirochaetota bacterium]